ncbi:MAG: Gfo/Idh/MocA family oxidoreductase [Chloroflexota bacterium]|nr:Gfo/Idh/MocA family oxidoreductase [Chloroflexota bacterium]
MTDKRTVRFAAVGLNHGHIYGQTNALLGAGAELACFFAKEPELAAQYHAAYQQAKLGTSVQAILEDESIDLIITAGIPCERAELGIAAMRHGKDFMSDKPGFTSLAQLEEARRVQAETGRIYSIDFSERFENRATTKAAELVRGGAIGQVVNTIGTGPHLARLETRPPWFFERAQYGGVITDIASHQFDQFLYVTGAKQVQIVAAQVANYNHPEHPELEDFGHVMLSAENCTGYIRVDWFTPDGLPTWGDGRLFVVGTEGTIEVRKYLDIAGRPGADHLFLVDQKGVQHIDCSGVELPYGRQLVYDILHRTESAMSQEHCFYASELALRAQKMAARLGYLAE